MSRDDRDLLFVDKITKNFGGHQVVNQVSFSLKSGSIGGLIGPNGAGKTTLFNCLAGFLKPSSEKSCSMAGASADSPPAMYLQPG